MSTKTAKTAKVGEQVTWKSLDGKKHTGTVYERDSNVLYIATMDGRRAILET